MVRKVLLSKQFISLFAQNFLAFSALNIFNVIPDYLARIGASRSYIGMFMNVNSLVLVLLVIPLSRYTDHFGRKRILMIGYMAALPSLALSFMFSGNLVFLLLMRVSASLAFCGFFTIHAAEIFEVMPRERRMAGMGIFGISGLMSNPVSSWLGEMASRRWGAPSMFLVSFGFMALALVLASQHRFHRPEKPVENGAFLALLKRPELAPLIVLATIMGGAFTIYASFLANLSRERLGLVAVSVFFASFTVIAIFSRMFLSIWMEGIQKSLLAAVSFALIALSFLASYFLTATWQLVPIGLMFGLGFSVVSPLMSAVFVNSGGEHEKLALNNLYLSTNTLGNFLFALGLGAMGDYLGLPFIFLAMGLIVLVAIPFSLQGIKQSVRAA